MCQEEPTDPREDLALFLPLPPSLAAIHILFLASDFRLGGASAAQREAVAGCCHGGRLCFCVT